MKLRILPSALADLTKGKMFYARLDQSVGEYFLESLFGDIDSLVHHAGSHRKVFGYHRLLARRFPFAIYYQERGRCLRGMASAGLQAEFREVNARIDVRTL